MRPTASNEFGKLSYISFSALLIPTDGPNGDEENDGDR